MLRDRGIPLIVVFIPTKLTVMHEYVASEETILDFPDPRDEATSMAAQLGRVCADIDAVYVDTTQRLTAMAANGDAAFYPNDSHFSPRGHEAVSELIAQAISEARP